jgi:hypothetical protein
MAVPGNNEQNVGSRNPLLSRLFGEAHFTVLIPSEHDSCKLPPDSRLQQAEHSVLVRGSSVRIWPSSSLSLFLGAYSIYFFEGQLVGHGKQQALTGKVSFAPFLRYFFIIWFTIVAIFLGGSLIVAGHEAASAFAIDAQIAVYSSVTPLIGISALLLFFGFLVLAVMKALFAWQKRSVVRYCHYWAEQGGPPRGAA